MPHRPYQQQALSNIAQDYQDGISRLLVVMATGLGKTAVATGVPAAIQMPRNKRLLFLVHMDELAYQAADAFRRWCPDRTVGIEKAQYRANGADIVVASVQTLGRGVTYEGSDGEDAWSYSPRLQGLNPDDFLVIETDEIHHAAKGKYYHGIYRYMQVLKGCGSDGSKLFIGFTATPDRSDGIGLECLCDKITFSYDLRNGQADGWLAKPIAWRVETEVDIRNVHNRGGDFADNELANAVNTPERNMLAVKWHKDKCPSAVPLFFCVDVKHSHDMAEMATAHGIETHPIYGNSGKYKISPDQVRKLIQMNREGHIGLASCQKILEGYDSPICSAGHLLRPTQSGLLYRQMVGRLSRLFPSIEDREAMALRGEYPDYIKDTFTIFDYVDNSRHPLVTIASLYGLREKFDPKGKSILPQVEEIERLESENPGLDLRAEPDMERVRSTISKLDLLQAPISPSEIRAISKLSWLKESSDGYALAVPDGTVLSIRENALGAFEIFRRKKGVRTLLSVSRSLPSAIEIAEREVPADKLNMMQGEKWRQDPPTDRQCKLHFDLDRDVRSKFRDWVEYYQFCKNRYDQGDTSFAKGNISLRIDRWRVARAH